MESDKRCLFGCMEKDDNKFLAFWAWQSSQMLWGNGPLFSRTDGKVAGGMKEWLKGLSVDVAIIHLGTNDLGAGISKEIIARNVSSESARP
jgi:hypothetical protein